MVLSESDVKRAFEFACERHSGQVDKAGTAYIGHLVWVATRLHVLFKNEATPELRIVALLHDIIEDGKATYEEVYERFGSWVALSVDCMTKQKNETYEQYIEGFKHNRDLSLVKLCDLEHNMQIDRIPEPTDRDYARLERYQKSMNYLKGIHGIE